mmetsp:Transcript_6201/g.15305  ORF Transcript_6201/g.15305 Transcript_6201/m.15305 type:complete len:344 (-) Transcript_6201:168-1199(-)
MGEDCGGETADLSTGPYVAIVVATFVFLQQVGVGTTLEWERLQKATTRPLGVLVGLAMQLAVLPFLGYSLSRALSIEGDAAIGLMFIATAPGGTGSNVVTYLAGGDTSLSATMTLATSTCAFVSWPALLTSYLAVTPCADFTIPLGTMLTTVLLQTAIPLGIGLAWKRRMAGKEQPRSLVRFRKGIIAVALAGIVAAAPASSASGLLVITWDLIAALAILNLGGFVIGFLVAASFATRALPESWRFDRSEVKAVPIEVSFQNVAMVISTLALVHPKGTALAAPAIYAWFYIPVLGFAYALRKLWPSDSAPTEHTNSVVDIKTVGDMPAVPVVHEVPIGAVQQP